MICSICALFPSAPKRVTMHFKREEKKKITEDHMGFELVDNKSLTSN